MECHPACVCGPLKRFSTPFPGLVLIEDPEVSVFEDDLCLQLLTVIQGLLMGHLFGFAHKAVHHLVLRPHWYDPGLCCLEHN